MPWCRGPPTQAGLSGVVDPEPEAESPVAKFLDELRATMDCLRFDP